MTIKMPVAIVEDEESSVSRLKIMLDIAKSKAEEEIGCRIELDLEVANDYSSGLTLIRRGYFPIAIIDLQLPDPTHELPSNSHYPEYSGISLIEIARKVNRDILIGLYTGNAVQAIDALFKLNINKFISKIGDGDFDEKKNIPILTELIIDCSTEFNYAIDVKTEEACRFAFGYENNWQKKLKSYEICLRRLLSRVRDGVYYDVIGKGRSGAGLVSVFIPPRYPIVIKMGKYHRLLKEQVNYDEYVKGLIKRYATTDPRQLSQSCDIGAIAYSFEGDISEPLTLGSVIVDQKIPIKDVQYSIEEHFKNNCKQWYLKKDEFPCDVGNSCRLHYFKGYPINYEEIFKLVPENALTSARYNIEKVLNSPGITIEKIKSKICNGLVKNWNKLICLAPSIIHGDLNVGNLIWNKNTKLLTLIDFEKTRNDGLRMIDFTKLEASIKFHLPLTNDISDDDINMFIVQSLELEGILLSSFEDFKISPESQGCDLINRKLSTIKTIRHCAIEQCGPRAEYEYFLSLFYVTAKHIGYSAKDLNKSITISNKKEQNAAFVALVHSLVSSFWINNVIEDL